MRARANARRPEWNLAPNVPFLRQDSRVRVYEMKAAAHTKSSRGPRKRLLRSALGSALYLGIALGAPEQAKASVSQNAVSVSLRSSAASYQDLEDFYRSRNYRPLWVTGSSLRPEALQVVALIQDAANDGFDPAAFGLAELRSVVQSAADGSPGTLARAELLLSRAFSSYARELRRSRNIGMLYVDHELVPHALSPRAILAAAAEAPSLAAYITSAVEMNPIYTKLRGAYSEYRASTGGKGPRQSVFYANLERARALPADLGRRFILVDTASAQLWMYEGGEVKDTMRVVVGRASDATPMMAAFIRYAAVNPYWNVPPDFVQQRIAPEVLRQGVSYLRNAKYEVLSGWSEDAVVVDPGTIDWKKVAAGQLEVRVRQTPGSHNSMGNVKFMFPNELGVYLHDTPNKILFQQSDRRQSSGCVRVEDAARLSRWLFQRDLGSEASAPEHHVALPEPVPVYITYFTVAAERDQVAFRNDVYARDQQLVEQLGGGSSSAAR